jgi:hypothetical protein
MIPASRAVLTGLGVSEGVRSMLALKTALGAEWSNRSLRVFPVAARTP